jgi:sorting and assembly machinery component 37
VGEGLFIFLGEIHHLSVQTISVKLHFIETQSMDLHIWGPLGKLRSFSPECLAAVWYATLVVDEPVTIYQSSNPLISPNGQLPALRHNGKTYGGFESIVGYFKSLGYDVDSNLNSVQKANSSALISYIASKVSGLSLYMLYLNRDNFESVIRPLFTTLVPFPMQYNLPIRQRDWAKKQCESSGLILAAAKVKVDVKKIDPVLSRTQELINEKKDQKDLLFSDAKENMRVLHRAKTLYDVLMASSLLTGDQHHTPYLISPDSVSTADLLLVAHLTVQSYSQFPVPILKTLLESHYLRLNQYKEDLYKKLEDLVEPISPTRPEDVYSLTNVGKWYLGWGN